MPDRRLIEEIYQVVVSELCDDPEELAFMAEHLKKKDVPHAIFLVTIEHTCKFKSVQKMHYILYRELQEDDKTPAFKRYMRRQRFNYLHVKVVSEWP